MSVSGKSNMSPEEALSAIEALQKCLTFNHSEAVSQNRFNMLDSLNVLPTFSGDSLSIDFHSFFEKFNSYASFFKWTPEEKLFALNLKLEGRARELVKLHSDESKNFDDIIKLLQNRYTVRKSNSEILAEFFSFSQPDTLTVEDFIAQAKLKVRKVSQALGIAEDDRAKAEENWLKELLLKNLNPNIRRGVIAKMPKTLIELEVAAKAEELAWKSTLPTFHNLPSTSQLNPFATEFTAAVDFRKDNSEIQDLKNLVKTLTTKVEQVTAQVGELYLSQASLNTVNNHVIRQPTNVNRQVIVCFACQGQGHISKNCPLKSNSNFYGNNNRSTYANNFGHRGNFNRGGYRNDFSNRGNYDNSYSQRGNFHRGERVQNRGGFQSHRGNRFSNQGASNRDRRQDEKSSNMETKVKQSINSLND